MIQAKAMVTGPVQTTDRDAKVGRDDAADVAPARAACSAISFGRARSLKKFKKVGCAVWGQSVQDCLERLLLRNDSVEVRGRCAHSRRE